MKLNLFNLSWITEINELFHDILIYWDAPVYIKLNLRSFMALLIDCQLMLEHNRPIRTPFRDELCAALVYSMLWIHFLFIKCLHNLCCPLLMQSHHKIILISADVVQNPTFAWGVSRLLDFSYDHWCFQTFPTGFIGVIMVVIMIIIIITKPFSLSKSLICICDLFVIGGNMFICCISTTFPEYIILLYILCTPVLPPAGHLTNISALFHWVMMIQS